MANSRGKSPVFKAVESLLSENLVSPMSGIGPRDSDNELLIQYLQFYTDIDLSSEQVRWLRTVSFESITRARRKLQEQGLYMPSPAVAQRRRLKGATIKQAAPKASAHDLQARIQRNG